MSKQELEEMYPVLKDTREVLSTLKEELEEFFPSLRIEDEKLVAELRGPEITLVGWLNNKRYFLGITYEERKLVIWPVISEYVDPSHDIKFAKNLIISIKNLIEEYHKGKKIDYGTAETWINSLEKRLKATVRNDKMKVILKPRYRELDTYKASGELNVTKGGFLTIKFAPIKCPRGMRFLVMGKLTTRRYKNIIYIIRSFERE
ncbi:MAG: hypothetical protein JHC26_11760 [Thermofilum sp.]|jgi:hypothetical protein|uniref:hypothetical protein n=1 Tax=Thermofilum sp. TaxID=1961369 RepID=UPI00258E2725|nr:hypothetical protein [Thermofilum sp.]MCI4409759.1 hypothetical protein [Thermofilum sp.]